MRELINRVKAKRQAEGLSIRQTGAATGVAFSLIAKSEGSPDRGLSRENERKLRAWLGDDVSAVPSDVMLKRAEELGRAMARACGAEIIKIVHEGIL